MGMVEAKAELAIASGASRVVELPRGCPTLLPEKQQMPRPTRKWHHEDHIAGATE